MSTQKITQDQRFRLEDLPKLLSENEYAVLCMAFGYENADQTPPNIEWLAYKIRRLAFATLNDRKAKVDELAASLGLKDARVQHSILPLKKPGRIDAA